MRTRLLLYAMAIAIAATASSAGYAQNSSSSASGAKTNPPASSSSAGSNSVDTTEYGGAYETNGADQSGSEGTLGSDKGIPDKGNNGGGNDYDSAIKEMERGGQTPPATTPQTGQGGNKNDGGTNGRANRKPAAKGNSDQVTAPSDAHGSASAPSPHGS